MVSDLLRCVVLFLLLTRLSFANDAELHKAVSAYESGNYDTAQVIFSRLAQQGHAMSQRYLGEMYDKGLGLRRNYRLAILWYRKAAEQHYAPAQYRLGVKYANGHGVSQDNKMAYAWFAVAFDGGHKKAANSIRVLNKTMSFEERQHALTFAYELREKFGLNPLNNPGKIIPQQRRKLVSH